MVEMTNNKILYVIVIYRCKLEDSRAFQSLIGNNAEEQKHLFVYDNSPYKQMTSIPVAAYIHDLSNSGLSKAYNQACQFAQAEGYQWLLLLDEDTFFPSHSLDAYKKAIKEHPAITLIAPRHKVSNGLYLSPTPYWMKTSALQAYAPTGIISLKKYGIINSGMLVSTESFINVGGYEEKVWLDFSDVCFIEKYKKAYTSLFILPDIVCHQAFSGIDDHPERIFKRFCIYLECARNYPKPHIINDAIALAITTMIPVIYRTIKDKTFKYIIAYWKYYILGKKTRR